MDVRPGSLMATPDLEAHCSWGPGSMLIKGCLIHVLPSPVLPHRWVYVTQESAHGCLA